MLDASEITALARLLDELDYYDLLQVDRAAEVSDIKRAFHRSSRNFHPDANRKLDAELKEASKRIAMRISEAYAVLRDPRRRLAYDQRLSAGSEVRIQLTTAREEAGRKAEEERAGKTPQGRQFCKLAEAAISRKDLVTAANNLQTALTFEPDNTHFKQRLAELRSQLR